MAQQDGAAVALCVAAGGCDTWSGRRAEPAGEDGNGPFATLEGFAPVSDPAVLEQLPAEARDLVADDVGLVGQPPQEFRLKEDSPAFAMGFESIPVAEIGLRRERPRA